MLVAYTVFWEHPLLGQGSHFLKMNTAKRAAEDTVELITHAVVNGVQGIDAEQVQKDLRVRVWRGSRYVKPSEEPAYEVNGG